MQYLGDLGCKYVVIKNDDKTVAEVQAMNPRGVLVSPGPGKTILYTTNLLLHEHNLQEAPVNAVWVQILWAVVNSWPVLCPITCFREAH